MKKVFPYYKGMNMANNPLGYTNRNCAKKRMRKDEIFSDFDALLPDDYWLGHMYTYFNGTKIGRFYAVDGFEPLYIIEPDYKNKIPFKSIESQNVKDLFKKLLKARDTNWLERTEEDIREIVSLSMRINELGYYPHLYKDETDYKRRFSKFVDDNVDFQVKEVTIDMK